MERQGQILQLRFTDFTFRTFLSLILLTYNLININNFLFQNTDLRSASGVGVKESEQIITIYIRWKHRYYEVDKYEQQKGQKGGLKKISLQSNKIYSVKDIINLGLAQFDGVCKIPIIKI